MRSRSESLKLTFPYHCVLKPYVKISDKVYEASLSQNQNEQVLTIKKIIDAGNVELVLDVKNPSDFERKDLLIQTLDKLGYVKDQSTIAMRVERAAQLNAKVYLDSGSKIVG